MIAFIEALKDDTCTPKPAKLNAWVYIYMFICNYIWLYKYTYLDTVYLKYAVYERSGKNSQYLAGPKDSLSRVAVWACERTIRPTHRRHMEELGVEQSQLCSVISDHPGPTGKFAPWDSLDLGRLWTSANFRTEKWWNVSHFGMILVTSCHMLPPPCTNHLVMCEVAIICPDVILPLLRKIEKAEPNEGSNCISGALKAWLCQSSANICQPELAFHHVTSQKPSHQVAWHGLTLTLAKVKGSNFWHSRLRKMCWAFKRFFLPTRRVSIPCKESPTVTPNVAVLQCLETRRDNN